MGRGRAKAKQTKVARELKYRTYDPDLGALQSELAGGDSRPGETYDEPYSPPEEYGEGADNRSGRRS